MSAPANWLFSGTLDSQMVNPHWDFVDHWRLPLSNPHIPFDFGKA